MAMGGDFRGRVPGDGHGMEDNVFMPIQEGPEQVGTLAVSPKEYVVDAHTMSALGNGNADKGADVHVFYAAPVLGADLHRVARGDDILAPVAGNVGIYAPINGLAGDVCINESSIEIFSVYQGKFSRKLIGLK